MIKAQIAGNLIYAFVSHLDFSLFKFLDVFSSAALPKLCSTVSSFFTHLFEVELLLLNNL